MEHYHLDITKSLSYQKQSFRDGLVNETIPVQGQMTCHANMCTHVFYITLVLINSHMHICEQFTPSCSFKHVHLYIFTHT